MLASLGAWAGAMGITRPFATQKTTERCNWRGRQGQLMAAQQRSRGDAFVANGIVAEHQEYLALGGLGIMLGDDGLTYGSEKIVETFYTAHLWRGFSVSYDFQHVTNPGYNQVRGPVSVSAVRFHTEF